jgi:hypothetical protein
MGRRDIGNVKKEEEKMAGFESSVKRPMSDCCLRFCSL